MKLERLLNVVEEFMAQSDQAVYLRKKAEESPALFILYAMTPHEMVAQMYKALYGLCGAEDVPDSWYTYLSSMAMTQLQMVLSGEGNHAFEMIRKIEAAQAAGDSGAVESLVAQFKKEVGP